VLGFEPTTYGSESDCATHYTTAPHKGLLNDLHSNVNKLQHDVNNATHIYSHAGVTNTTAKPRSSDNGNAVHDHLIYEEHEKH